ncbi:MAG: EamA family transporter [Gammaproteobacteria bacterium]|nr:EamA family transporter [Gammaproteobacteria bacterium]
MELWIPLTIAAAFFQNIRSALQKHLTGKLSTLGAAYVRFVYAGPIALIYFLVVISTEGQPLPDLSASFLLYALLGGVCQIMFTIFLLWLFSFHNFAVGTTFSKLETVMVAVFGLILLGEKLTTPITIAIAISTLGLVILSAGQAKLGITNLIRGLWRLPTLIGLACAAWLGMGVVLFRAALLSLAQDSFLLASSFTLLIVLILQIAMMGVLLRLREPGQLSRVLLHWRPAALVGISGGLASIGWFSAFTLQNATYVRALGQIELIFTFAATLLAFREKVSPKEVAGIVLITLSIILILLAA